MTLVASMSLKKIHIESFLSALEVDFYPVQSDESEQLKKLWLFAYAARVKNETGLWIHNRFRWNGFSYGHQTAVSGSDALIAYQSQWQAPYVIFDEEDTWAYLCTSEKYPDLTSFRADIYVAHHNMKWTMVFTHEQPDIGPYFAFKSKNVD